MAVEGTAVGDTVGVNEGYGVGTTDGMAVVGMKVGEPGKGVG